MPLKNAKIVYFNFITNTRRLGIMQTSFVFCSRLAVYFNPVGIRKRPHDFFYIVGPTVHVSGRGIRPTFERIGKRSGDQGGLPGSQLRGTRTEKPLGRRLRAIDSPSHFRHVQIHFQNTLLPPYRLDKQRKISLHPFSEPAPAGIQKYIFGRLLRNSTRAP